MEYLIVRFAEVENRKDITNSQGDIVGAEIKFKFLPSTCNLGCTKHSCFIYKSMLIFFLKMQQKRMHHVFR